VKRKNKPKNSIIFVATDAWSYFLKQLFLKTICYNLIDI